MSLLKLQIASDLHCEFQKDRGTKFISHLYEADVDALIVAGDLCTMRGFYPTFKLLSELYEHILYVPGNHEYYGASPEEVHDELKAVVKDFPTVHCLQNSVCEIKGQRFYGGTLWFPDLPDNPLFKHFLSDFAMIDDFEPWVYRENDHFRLAYKEAKITSKDIIISHHMPSPKSTPDYFKGSELNRFFVSDEENLISMTQPKLWVHGHTHSSMDYKLGDTRILCNPFGYAERTENRQFKRGFVIST